MLILYTYYPHEYYKSLYYARYCKYIFRVILGINRINLWPLISVREELNF